jgi:peptidoglycan/LPS O-acetylase OafA/YrhL
VAVDLFLLLSGFGLALGAMKRETKPLQFYWRRVVKLFGALWLSLGIIMAIDYCRLSMSWPWRQAVLAFLGVVPRTDLYRDINSPLWYVTLTLFLYAVFPWLFRRRHPVIGMIAVTLASWGWCALAVPRLMPEVAGLYGVHRFAFALGVMLAVVTSRAWVRKAWHGMEWTTQSKGVRFVASALIGVAAAYLVVHSGVGRSANVEEGISLLTVLLVVASAIMKPWRFRFLAAAGVVSYEAYLLHWPLLSRHDWLFGHWPPWAALVAFLILLYAAAVAVHWIAGRGGRAYNAS